MEDTVLDVAGVARPAGSVAGRVLLVSNRLPMTVTDETGASRPSCGGLVAGLKQVAQRWPVVWVGWDGLGRCAGEPPQEAEHPWGHGSVVALALTEEEVARFYRRYCNALLWPALHGRTVDELPDEDDWQAYRAVNRRYAEAVLRRLRPGDRVWIHDYHLLLVPGMLRERADVPVAFFLHTAFPDPEVFGRIPQAEALLRGLLAADRIGFHTDGYAANFLRTAAASGYAVRGSCVTAEREARIQVHPMGIDVDAFGALSHEPDVLDDVAGLRRGRGRLLVGVDRLDYTKGIPQRLLAFELLLEQHPRLRGAVTLLQVAVPTRQEIAAYRDLKEVVEGLVRRINARFARPGWLPIDYIYGSVDLGSLAALYRAADVMVVTPVRDGLNLVAKEFVATRTDGDGVLVLSRFAGAAEELDAALQVDPNKTCTLAETFHAALTMGRAERRRRMRALRRAITSNTVLDWARALLGSLEPVPVAPPPRPGRAPLRGGAPGRPSVPVAARAALAAAGS